MSQQLAVESIMVDLQTLKTGQRSILMGSQWKCEDVRLVLAFGAKEPCCQGDSYDDHDADQNAPSTRRIRVYHIVHS